MRNNLGDSWTTYVEIDDIEYHPCVVNYDASQAEPDNNWAGGLDIESVMYKGEDLWGRMSPEAVEDLIQRTTDQLNEMAEDPRW